MARIVSAYFIFYLQNTCSRVIIVQGEIMEVNIVVKPSFSVIGKLGQGPSISGPEWVPSLWNDANSNFNEIKHLAKYDSNGNIAGLWGAMSDIDELFRPWGVQGKYLAGCEAVDGALAPQGWTKWIIPGFKYIAAECQQDSYARTFRYVLNEYMPEHGHHLAGAVHEHYPQDGRNVIQLYFPVDIIADNVDAYSTCPVYESENFILRLVQRKDADELLGCYSDLSAVQLMNADNCINDFHYTTLKEMHACIDFWLDEYRRKSFVRFSVIDKRDGRAVGTIEMFGTSGDHRQSARFGVLRVDLRSSYECSCYIAELIRVANEHFYKLFNVAHIVIKAIPAAAKRITALEECGYSKIDRNKFLPFNDYYIK
jgi:predicted transcriptional regulator YdeE/RimJ/RimL family protein N-acetyltransferase